MVKSNVNAQLVITDYTGEERKIILQGTLYIPDFRMNIWLMSKLFEKKRRAEFAKEHSYLELCNDFNCQPFQ
jgi:hypothetical protein